jgi:hypothetical protein
MRDNGHYGNTDRIAGAGKANATVRGENVQIYKGLQLQPFVTASIKTQHLKTCNNPKRWVK